MLVRTFLSNNYEVCSKAKSAGCTVCWWKTCFKFQYTFEATSLFISFTLPVFLMLPLLFLMEGNCNPSFAQGNLQSSCSAKSRESTTSSPLQHPFVLAWLGKSASSCFIAVRCTAARLGLVPCVEPAFFSLCSTGHRMSLCDLTCRCPALAWCLTSGTEGKLCPPKYLVSSCSLKWNWLFIGFSLYDCHQRRLFPPFLFSACQFPLHSYRQPLALINTNHCVTAHARLL